MNASEIVNECKERIKGLESLSSAINWNSIEAQLRKNPNLYLETPKIGTPLNLVESIMRPYPCFGNSFNYKLNLEALNSSIEALSDILDQKEKKNISDKISNLSNTSFWDTMVELWFAKELKDQKLKIRLDYPLTECKKSKTPPNADIAIIDQNDEPILLIDCLCPTLEGYIELELSYEDKYFSPNQLGADLCISKKIRNKFELKFASHVDSFPKTKFVLILSLIKFDELSFHLEYKPIWIDTSENNYNKRMDYAVVVRFDTRNDNTLGFYELIEFGRGKDKYSLVPGVISQIMALIEK
jgi:hypothetical protein